MHFASSFEVNILTQVIRDSSPEIHLQHCPTRICPTRICYIESVSACTQWTHHCQQKALSSVEWLMARAGDGGPALNRHWVDVSCCWA